MIKAHVTSVRVHGGAVEADSFTTGDTVDTGATVATTTSTETLIDTVISRGDCPGADLAVPHRRPPPPGRAPA